jgi:molybdenum cofactor cytidylyltransferase
MDLVTALRASPHSRIAFVGAGGKTSAIFALARQFDGPVIVTATTHLAEHQRSLADQNIIVEKPSDINLLEEDVPDGVTLLTGPVGSDQRSSGLDRETMKRVKAIADSHNLPLLIEADGSRQRSLKAPAEHEPNIPEFVDSVIVVAGLSVLGQPLNEKWVHRPERFAQLSGLNLGDQITTDGLSNFLMHKSGGLMNILENTRPIAMLNQVDTPEKEASAQKLTGQLIPRFSAVVVADLAHYSDDRESRVQAAYEPVAGIILAGGESKRLGKPKQLLDWHGQPFIRHIVETAINAGLSPVVVVTGAESDLVKPVVADLPVTIAHNPNWQIGQSESVKAGLAALPENTGSAIFLLVDQPQVPVSLLHKLVATHATSMAPIVGPQVGGQRGNPVLFDRVTFPDLAEIRGDAGGRAIFARHRVKWISWLDASLRLDVDTWEDYEALRKHNE